MGPRRRVVLDTNVLVSAIGWRGNERELYERCRSEDLQLATSPALLEELRRVLKYPKFALDETEIQALVTDILCHAVVVSPSKRLEIVKEDPDDNRVLECAVTAEARLIVSGDKHLLELGRYEGTRIIRAREALIEFVDR